MMNKRWMLFFKKHNPSWILKFVPDETFLQLKYWAKKGKQLDLDNPTSFTEKIQWLKLYDQKPVYTQMVDKCSAKEYVAKVLGDKYIIPNIGVWNDVASVDFESLPNQFVIKCTHDSGGLIICKDKSKLDVEAAKQQLQRCMERNWFYFSREYAYKALKPRIIAEEYLENDCEEGLHDYKVWCFNGEPKYIQYVSGRIGARTYEGFYDTDWNLQNFTYHNPPLEEDVPKPVCLKELVDVARKVSQGIPFLRADFYILPDNSIRFGELTFYPNGGWDTWTPKETDEIIGNLINLNA